MSQLVLSLFPGIGLLDMAFEAEGFTVVRGPDLLWGGDIHRFHPPAGRFDGVIGGPPCQAFSRLAALVRHNGYQVAPNLIPEFERVVREAQPAWFIMENVEGAPAPTVDGYRVHAQLVNNRWVGGIQNRVRRFSFGTQDGRLLRLDGELVALEPAEKVPTVTANGGRWVPVKLGGSGKVKRTRDGRELRAQNVGDRSRKFLSEAVRAQGLPDDFDLPPFTVAAKVKAVGNGVPLPMGRAIARAVRRALARGAA